MLTLVAGVSPAGAAPGDITEYDLSPGFDVTRDITTGRDGAMWFTELVGDRIGRISYTGAITEFELPNPGSGPLGIVQGPDCNMWFTESFVNKIGRLETDACDRACASRPF